MIWKEFTQEKPTKESNSHAGRSYAYVYLKCLLPAFTHKLVGFYYWDSDVLNVEGMILDQSHYMWLSEEE